MARDGVQAFLLSAAHCGSAPNSVHNGVGVPIGSVAGTVRSFQGSDTMLINVSLSGSSVYDGPWDNPTNSTDTVIGSTNNYANDQVCTSGSFSGVRCGIVVTNPNATVNLGGYFITEVYAQRTAHRRHNGRRPRGGGQWRTGIRRVIRPLQDRGEGPYQRRRRSKPGALRG